jgi:hypothetical protein
MNLGYLSPGRTNLRRQRQAIILPSLWGTPTTTTTGCHWLMQRDSAGQSGSPSGRRVSTAVPRPGQRIPTLYRCVTVVEGRLRGRCGPQARPRRAVRARSINQPGCLPALFERQVEGIASSQGTVSQAFCRTSSSSCPASQPHAGATARGAGPRAMAAARRAGRHMRRTGHRQRRVPFLQAGSCNTKPRSPAPNRRAAPACRAAACPPVVGANWASTSTIVISSGWLTRAGISAVSARIRVTVLAKFGSASAGIATSADCPGSLLPT